MTVTLEATQEKSEETVINKTTSPQTNDSSQNDTANGFNIPKLMPMDEYNAKLQANVSPPAWRNPQPAPMYNLAIIGSGSAGLVAAVGAAGLGAKVAMIERHALGGDCLNVGCVPSKSIIRPSKAMGEIIRAEQFGINVPDGVNVDFSSVMKRMRRVRADISEHDSAAHFAEIGIDLFFGEGRFGGPDTVEVVRGDDIVTLNFKKALISTGSRPAPLPIPGLAEAGYLTNETVFSLTEAPKSLAIIGAGPIGAELAQAFNRFGIEITIFDLEPQLLGREDPDAAAVIKNVFETEGIHLVLGAKTSKISGGATGKTLHYELNGEEKTLTVDEILVSVGRIPNIDNLNLEAANIDYHKKGVTVDDQLVTTNENVFAAGDVAQKYQFTHTADATARIVLQNALFPGPKKKLSNLVVPWSTYTDPEVAHVGMYESDAKEQGIKVETFVQSIGDVDRGKTDGELEGFVKVHVKKGTDKILGATIVASHAGEMINELTLAMTAEIGLKTLATVIHPYPTQSEAIKKIADAYNRTRMTPLVEKIFSWWMKFRLR